jgi:hypothetical protein
MQWGVVKVALFLGVVVVSGCGQGDSNRENDPGPPIQMNPDGPGAMKPPGEGGGSTLPAEMEKTK